MLRRRGSNFTRTWHNKYLKFIKMELLLKIKEQGVSVSYCARIMGVSKRTLQDHLDVPKRLTIEEEKKIKYILTTLSNLMEELKSI